MTERAVEVARPESSGSVDRLFERLTMRLVIDRHPATVRSDLSRGRGIQFCESLCRSERI